MSCPLRKPYSGADFSKSTCWFESCYNGRQPQKALHCHKRHNTAIKGTTLPKKYQVGSTVFKVDSSKARQTSSKSLKLYTEKHNLTCFYEKHSVKYCVYRNRYQLRLKVGCTRFAKTLLNVMTKSGYSRMSLILRLRDRAHVG